MGKAFSCIRRSKDVLLDLRGRSIDSGHGETTAAAFGGECGSRASGGLVRGDDSESLQRATRSGSDVGKRIESSKVHWSQVTEVESDFDDEEAAEVNRHLFEELQSHSTWGDFFMIFGYDTEVALSLGELVVEEKFAEGGQAELFHAKVIWRDLEHNKFFLDVGAEWVLKVFKKGTPLRDLQSQWPLDYLQWRVQVQHESTQFCCQVYCGTLLEDGRFAFLMTREHEDLRSQIDRVMLEIGDDHRPFLQEEVERIMFCIALGMDCLHSLDIVHRDLKASNVLVNALVKGFKPNYYVADFECSVGVVGTGFFRAPEILQDLKNKVPSMDMKVFTKAADMYSYGMTFYEVLTGKLPFEGHRQNDYDLVLYGE